ncbi:MAG: hypothetical protein IJF49_09125 [Clostridia bacterium]|nr:hypothetical protein [Clostridia bacterium]
MKKRHLYIILLALLTSLLMLLPVFAEGMRGAVSEEKPAGEELSQRITQLESVETDLEKKAAQLSAEVEEITRRITQLESEKDALEKETDQLLSEHLRQIGDELTNLRERLSMMEAKLNNEKESINQVQKLREEIERARAQIACVQNSYDLACTAEPEVPAQTESPTEPDWGKMFDLARAQISCPGHLFGEPQPYSETMQVRCCVLCGYETYGCIHEYGKWVQYSDVQMVRRCQLCLHTDAIPMQRFNCTHEGWEWTDIAEHAQMRQCPTCNEIEYRQNPAHVHEYSEWGKYSKERIGRTCLTCGRAEFLTGAQ